MIAVAADLHIGKNIKSSRRDLANDSYRALESMRDSIMNAYVNSGDESLHIILAGDIFDEKKISGGTLKAFTEFIDYFYDQGVTVYFIQGNHDTDSVEAIASIQGAQHIHKKSVTLDGCTVYGLDWQPKDKIKEELTDVPECDILVLHQMFEHLSGFAPAADCSLDDVPSHVGDIVVGDVHVRDKTTRNGVSHCISPGPLHPCSIDQPGPHGFFALPLKGEWRFHSHSTRTISRLHVMDEKGIETLKKSLSDLMISYNSRDGLEPIVEIKYNALLSSEVEEAIKGREHIKFFLKPFTSSFNVSAEELAEARKKVQDLTPESSLHVLVDPVEQKELFDFTMQCLTGDVDATLDSLLEAYGL